MSNRICGRCRSSVVVQNSRADKIKRYSLNSRYNSEQYADYKILIKITFDRLVEMLEERRQVFCSNGIDDCVWDYYIELLRKNDGCSRPTNNDPQIIVDNLYVNGNWGDYDNYKSALETDEEFELRAIREGAVVFPDERIVIYKSPVMEDIIYG